MSLRMLSPEPRGRASHSATGERTAGEIVDHGMPLEQEGVADLTERPRWRRFLDGTLGSIKQRLTILASLVIIFSIATVTFAAYATVSQILWRTSDSLLRSQAQS